MSTREYQNESTTPFDKMLQSGELTIHPSKVDTKWLEGLPYKFTCKKAAQNSVAVTVKKNPFLEGHFFEKPESTVMTIYRDKWDIRRANTDSTLIEGEAKHVEHRDMVKELIEGYFTYLTKLVMLEARTPRKDKEICLEVNGEREHFIIDCVWKRPGTERDIYSSEFDYDLTLKDSPKLITSSLDWWVRFPARYLKPGTWVRCDNCTMLFGRSGFTMKGEYDGTPIHYLRDKDKVMCGTCLDYWAEFWDEKQWT